MVCRFCVGADHQEAGFEIYARGHETWSIGCHVGIHVDFYIHLAFTYSVGPPNVV